MEEKLKQTLPRTKLISVLQDLENPLTAKVTPKASSNRVKIDKDETGKPCLRVYVTCVPEHGKANKAVIELLSKFFHQPKSAFTIIHGLTDRKKIIKIDDTKQKDHGRIR